MPCLAEWRPTHPEELMATKVASLGKGAGSYILDIGAVKQVGNVSGTAGHERTYNEVRMGMVVWVRCVVRSGG